MPSQPTIRLPHLSLLKGGTNSCAARRKAPRFSGRAVVQFPALRSVFIAGFLVLASAICAQSQQTYLGFDRNDYPGDAALPALRKTFDFTGYWLNNPPGEDHNSWAGKRALLKRQGFGFAVLFNGRLDRDLKGKDAAALGTTDGHAAAASATHEGFPANVLIFLDIEEGGRMLPEQSAYIFAWTDAVRKAGARAGVYCSGIDVPEGSGTISTARDLTAQQESRVKSEPQSGKKAAPIVLWIANDQCPPAPGCSVTRKPPEAGFSVEGGRAAIWQYAQSPRRKQFTASCAKTYSSDGNCYAPGLPHSPATFLDMNLANSPDPSEAP